MTNFELPFGYRVTYERVFRGRRETVTRGRKSPHRAHAVCESKHQPGFIRLISCEPLTPAQYEREFPAGAHNKRKRYVQHHARSLA